MPACQSGGWQGCQSIFLLNPTLRNDPTDENFEQWPQKRPERGSANIVFRQQHRLSKMNALETRQTPRGHVLLAASITVRGAFEGRRVLIRNLSRLACRSRATSTRDKAKALRSILGGQERPMA